MSYYMDNKVGEYVEVADIGDGGGYDWAVFAVFQSPDGKLYYGQDSGCSCNSPFDYSTESDLTGPADRPGILAAATRFAEDYSSYVTPLELGNFANKIMSLEVAR